VIPIYEVGIVYVKNTGQSEDQIFLNTISPAFINFCSLLGNSNCEGLFQTTWKGNEIHYHTAPFMSSNNRRSSELILSKKSKICNAITIIVFMDDTEAFNPLIFTTQVTHQYVVVQPTKSGDGKFTLTSYSKGDIPPFLPSLSPLMEFNSNDLIEFLLYKVINGYRATQFNSFFRKRTIEVRKIVLTDIVKNFVEGVSSA